MTKTYGQMQGCEDVDGFNWVWQVLRKKKTHERGKVYLFFKKGG